MYLFFIYFVSRPCIRFHRDSVDLTSGGIELSLSLSLIEFLVGSSLLVNT